MVGCYIILYAITPLHYWICKKIEYPKLFNICVIILLIALVSIPVPEYYETNDCIIHNGKHVLYTLPVFYVGFMLAPLSKNKGKVSILWMVFVPLLIVGIEKIFQFGYWPGMLVLPLIYGLCKFFDVFNEKIHNIFNFFCKISLESYLFNTSIPNIILIYLPSLYNSPWNKGCYLSYGLSIIIGTILAYIVN